MHKIRIPITWSWVLGYSVLITAISEIIYRGSKVIDESVPIHIEVLLPAFVIGCIIAYPKAKTAKGDSNMATSVEEHDKHAVLETPSEKRVAYIVAGSFMVLVGLSMPLVIGDSTGSDSYVSAVTEPSLHAAGVPEAEAFAVEVGASAKVGRLTAAQPSLGWGMILFHVLVVTIISNLGKMFPAFCYRKEAHWRERLAVAIGMWPRGEVGAGVLVISLSYGIGGPVVTIAMLSLALNLMLTGVFIYFVKQLTAPLPQYSEVR
jgi:hypothetical protein